MARLINEGGKGILDDSHDMRALYVAQRYNEDDGWITLFDYSNEKDCRKRLSVYKYNIKGTDFHNVVYEDEF